MNCINYKNLREKSFSFEKRELSVNKSYSGELFADTPWYTSTLEDIDCRISVDCSDVKEAVIEEKPVLEISEKESTINSFKNFADNELKEKEEIEIKGSTVTLKSSNEGAGIIELECTPYEDLKDYLEMLNSCKSCQDHIASDYSPVSDLRGTTTSGIDILFVGGRPGESNYTDGIGSSFPREIRDLVKKMALAMNLNEESYANSLAIKCMLEDGESVTCLKNLMQEIYILKPKIVVTFGAFATNTLLGKKRKLSQIHGKIFNKTINFGNELRYSFNFMPIFHPEFLLINPKMKRAAWEDLQKVVEYIGQA